MKKSLLLSIVFSAITFITFAQTKPTTTTKPATTTAKPKTTTPVKKAPAKPAAKTTVAKPVTTAPAVVKPAETPAVVAPTPPAEVVKEPSGPPVTGPLGDGPKSYQAEPASKGTTKTTATKTTSSKTATAKPAKTAAPKPEKVRSNSADDEVRSYIGIRGGYNLATLNGIETELGADVKVPDLAGYMGGIVINIGVSKAFSIQPEILYSQQGFQVDYDGGYGKFKQTLVNVPLLLKLAFGSPKIKFFINAGPYIGYKLSQSSEISALGEVTKTDIEFTKDYDVDGTKDNMFDFGGIGGAGFQFGLGRALLTLEGRYQYGMADPSLYKDGIPDTVPKNFGHQRVMTGTVGLLFPLGGR